MKNNYVDSSSLVLFYAANKDIINIAKLVNDKSYDLDISYEDICYKSTQAVEKYLKGYLVQHFDDIEKSHNLIYLCERAKNNNNIFNEIWEE